MSFSRIDKAFVSAKTNIVDVPDKKLSAYIHWPTHIKPLITAPSSQQQQHQKRICALFLHPHPKFGGSASNNVVDGLCNMLTNNLYLTAKQQCEKPPRSQTDVLYDMSYYDKDVQKSDLVVSNRKDGTYYKSKVYGDLTCHHLLNVYDAYKHDVPQSATTSENAAGIITVRYNQSGIEDSDGTATWTGASTEVDDFHVILQWILSPQSGIYPTDLFILGYSFGACIVGTGLNRIYNHFLYQTEDKPAFFRQSSLFHELSSTLRGCMFLSYPCGFVPRTLFAGQHMTHLRSINSLLLHQNNNTPKSTDTEYQKYLAAITTTPNGLNNKVLTPNTYFNKTLFVLDQDDEFAAPQTLVNLLSTFDYPLGHDYDAQRKKLLLLLNTKTSHFWSGSEHVIALIFNQFMYTRLFIEHVAACSDFTRPEIDSASTTPVDTTSNTITNHNTIMGKKYPPHAYHDDTYRVYIHDMNIWIVFVFLFLVIGKIAYSRYEQYNLSNTLVTHTFNDTNNHLLIDHLTTENSLNASQTVPKLTIDLSSPDEQIILPVKNEL